MQRPQILQTDETNVNAYALVWKTNYSERSVSPQKKINEAAKSSNLSWTDFSSLHIEQLSIDLTQLGDKKRSEIKCQ